MLRQKRIYDQIETSDGYRMLVDRLWPRGISKEKAKLDSWEKNIAPTNELRKAFHHGEIDFATFKNRYLEEISMNEERFEFLKKVKTELEKGNVTFLFAAKSETENQASVLAEWVLTKI